MTRRVKKSPCHPSALRLKAVGASLLAAALLAACGVFEIQTESGDVLFQDSFSRPISGWDRTATQTFTADYRDGVYAVNVLEPSTDVWVTPGLSFRDVRILVLGQKTAGSDDNLFGIVCRYQNERNFYFFSISSDGFAGIGINKDGRRRILTGDTLLPTSAIRPGEQPNHIRADCIGYQLALYVNGRLIGQAQAAEWSGGQVGLLVGTYDEPGVEIVFDNFSVLQP